MLAWETYYSSSLVAPNSTPASISRWYLPAWSRRSREATPPTSSCLLTLHGGDQGGVVCCRLEAL